MMFFIGDNNSREVTQETLDKYLAGEHRANCIYGLAKGNMFWAKDIAFGSVEQAGQTIKSYKSRGFKVYHNIEDTKVAAEEKVDPVEEVKRKGSSRSRGKE